MPSRWSNKTELVSAPFNLQQQTAEGVQLLPSGPRGGPIRGQSQRGRSDRSQSAGLGAGVDGETQNIQQGRWGPSQKLGVITGAGSVVNG